MAPESSCVQTTKFVRYVWPFFNIVRERVKKGCVVHLKFENYFVHKCSCSIISFLQFFLKKRLVYTVLLKFCFIFSTKLSYISNMDRISYMVGGSFSSILQLFSSFTCRRGFYFPFPFSLGENSNIWLTFQRRHNMPHLMILYSKYLLILRFPVDT